MTDIISDRTTRYELYPNATFRFSMMDRELIWKEILVDVAQPYGKTFVEIRIVTFR